MEKRFFLAAYCYLLLWLALPPENKIHSTEKINMTNNTKQETSSTLVDTDKEKNMNRFVIHKHNARRLHFDLRLEYAGVLKSWAIPKGISTKNNIKRLAIETPEHALSYINFEGEIEEGYGKGSVSVWDSGTYKNLHQDEHGNTIPFATSLRDGIIDIEFFGAKINGRYTLIRIKQNPGKEAEWLITKVTKTKSTQT